MSLTRRDFLRLAGLVSASTVLAACGPVYRRLAGDLPVVPWSPLSPADFLALNRLTFGPRVEERARFSEIGLQAYVEEQLAYEALDDFDCELLLTPFKTLKMAANELEGLSDQLFENYDRERVPSELRQATLLRQLYSRRQLYEVMVEFWTDHFNIFIEKGSCFYLKTIDDREVIRPQALGSFRDLLWASAHSPAMLVYLDNQANEQRHPNENYARELMELHTLGVNGGYSQQDVMELARCLTGWTVKEHFWLGEFTFKAELHDAGPKRVLGLELQPAGQAEGEQVIEQLVRHPSTARFIAAKLSRRFLADEPPPAIVERAADTFLKTKGDVRAMLRVILLDGLPLAQPKYKRPLNFVLSALRLLNVETDGVAVQEQLLRLGQAYFNWPTPDGYPDRSDAWQGSLMPRWRFAFALARDELAGTKQHLPDLLNVLGTGSMSEEVDGMASLLLGSPLEEAARDELIGAVRAAGATDNELRSILTAGLLASPAFQWR